MDKRTVFKELSVSKKLPTPSRVALELVRLCHNEDTSLQKIAEVIETDPALSAELLKYANSVLLAGVQPVASVRRAAVKIGLNGVVHLALSFSLLAQHQDGACREFNYPRFWSTSLAQAVAARAIASAGDKWDPDEMFTCGLLSHVGELALATAFPEEYAEILSRTLDTKSLLAAERRAFGLNQHELTAELLRDWGLPKHYSLATQFHENYVHENIYDEHIAELAELLYLALQIAKICQLELPLARTFIYVEELADKHAIPADTFGAFFDEVVNMWQEWGYLFRISTQQCPLYHQIKSLDSVRVEDQEGNRLDDDLLILAVDDDPLTLLNLSRMLDGENRKIITAEDGEKALQIALEQQPEMVITDWRMPRLDGLELCELLRRTNVTRHIYIIMLTSCEATDELLQAFDAGADDYVVKPFTPKVLEARIRSGERIIRYQRMVNHDREVIQRYASKLTAANRKLQTMAMTDALTGLPNRRSAMSRLKDVVAESSRFGEHLSCIMIDVDHFKRINDTYGHDNGDIVLKEVATIFSKTVRSYDMVSRIGGEEFLVISTRSDRQESYQLAQRLREAVASHQTLLSDGSAISVTISLGVTTWNDSYTNAGELIKAADRALYKAKDNGRNRVEPAWEL